MATAPQQFKIEEKIEVLEPLCLKIVNVDHINDKIEVVSSFEETKKYLRSSELISKILPTLNSDEIYPLKAVMAIGQGDIVFHGLETSDDPRKALLTLSRDLFEVERFYDTIGGIIGYYLTVLKLIKGNTTEDPSDSSKEERLHSLKYEEPEGLDVMSNSEGVRTAVRWGIEAMREMAEIYPVGGAGDRLNLKDPQTGELLPAAQLSFCGYTLLEGLIRDLQGREFLYYKLFGKQLTTPLAIMTSHEKNNHNRILDICRDHEWFGRSKDRFTFFIQSMVPVITVDGDLAMKEPLKMLAKPGGHGVIWKVARDQGVFSWLESMHCHKAIVRQINNPVAGTDRGLLALSGIGSHGNKDFGFASCYRLVNAAEGMDVLREKKVNDGYEYCITNVEYTEFKYCGLVDAPVKPGSSYSRFPSNTNVLFIDLAAVKKSIDLCPIPGMLINMKTKSKCYTAEGYVEKQAGRLESTMQNIADVMVDVFPKKLEMMGQKHNLRTFLTYNERRKTISVTKQLYLDGHPLNGTPDGCFYELMQNYRELLTKYCGIELPPQEDEQEYLAKGPAFVSLFHPAMGVIYPIIGQKIHGGRIAKDSEWIMEIGEAEVKNLDLDGSLIVEAESIFGKKDPRGLIVYDDASCGKCTLINVKVRNLGVEKSSLESIWRRSVNRHETLHILLHGNAEFYAEDVTLEGDVHFEVPHGHRLVVYQQAGEIAWHYETIPKATWHWEYVFDDADQILLERI